jgi:hypothetical protein
MLLGLAPLTATLALHVVGLFLSPLSRERARIGLPSSPEAVWATLTDLDAMPAWRAELEGVERLPDARGAVRWREVSRGRRLVLERVEAVPPVRMVVQRAGEGVPGLRWIYEVSRIATGSELVLTAERRVGPPALRPLVRVYGADRRYVERITAALRARAEAHRQQLAGRPPG